MESQVSRRRFLKMSVLAGTGAALGSMTACAPKSLTDTGAVNAAQTSIPWLDEYDAIVVGAGAAGLNASIALAEEGLSAIMYDAGNTATSSSAICDGYITMCETEQVPDSREELFADIVASAQGDCQQDMVQMYVDNAPALYERLKGYGVTFLDPMPMSYMSKPWAHFINGGGNATSKLLEQCQANGTIIENDTRVIDLVWDDAARKVIGVNIGTIESPKYVKANRGVILATGDFTRNATLTKAYGPFGAEKIVPVSGPNCNGDGFIMAMRLGGSPAYVSAGTDASLSVGVQTNRTLLQYMTNGAICIGIDGKRFHDESDNYVRVSRKALALGGLHFQVYDSPMRAMLESQTDPAFAVPTEPEFVGNTLREAGEAVKATYAEFDVEGMIEQVEAYNGYVEAGYDPEFGREHMTGISGNLVKIETGPFYILPCNCAADQYYGGLHVDPYTRVLDMEDQPIGGLYAAGKVTGGVNGWGYMSGTGFGGAMIFGRIAAQTLKKDSE